MTTILYIEDNEQNLYLVSFLLQRHGFAVTGASDGRRGLELALAQPFDLILLDIQLPGMNGYDVARALRSHSRLARTPIVALTSYAMAGDRDKARLAGCDGYIEKPIDPDTFIAQLQPHLPPAEGG
ncbi:MAG: response regulator [Desulfuromonas thiophila]|nr:response regulator [Desulfuromonas thiophila]